MKDGMRHLWVERLTAGAVLWALLHVVRHPTTVYCTERTLRGHALACVVEKLLGHRLSFELRVLDMAVTDETGHALYRRHEIMLARLSRSVIPDDPEYLWLPAAARPHGDLWCRVLASSVHDRWHLTIAFLVWVENLYRTAAMVVPAGGVVALIPDGWLSHHISREFVAVGRSPITAGVLPNPLYWLLYYPLPLYPLIGALRLAVAAHRHPPKAAVDPRGIAAGTILAQYHAGALNSQLRRANLLWHESSGIESRRVIVLFNRAEEPINDGVRQLVDRKGFGWIEDMAQVYSAERPLRTFAAELARLLAVLPRHWSSLAVSRWSMLAYLSLRVASCRKLFRRYNVRLCALSWNFFTETGIIALSAQYEGGIYVRWNKSMHGPFQNIFHRAMAHIAFVWGDYDRAFLRAHDFRCPLFLTSGVVAGDDADELGQRAVLNMRKSMAPQVSFVVGLFDTGHTRKLYNSESHIIAYYRHMLAAVQANRRWACIIKSKAAVYKDLPPIRGIQDVVAELTRENRCLVLDGGQPASSLALAVDAVVCCNINMAGHLVAMHGVPALHLDYSGQYYVNWYDHPAAAKCFFTNAAAVTGALEKIERGDHSWGDASSWRDLLDHFHDGQGPRRIGEAIRFYMDQVCAGMEVEAALEKLGDWYADRYGPETVRRLGDGRRDDVDAWFAASHDKFYADRPRSFPNAGQWGRLAVRGA